MPRWIGVVALLLAVAAPAAPASAGSKHVKRVPTFTIACPSSFSILDEAGTSFVVTYAPATTTGGKAPITIDYAPISGSVFPVGTTTVTATARSSDGQVATCSFTITLQYVAPPPAPPPPPPPPTGQTWTVHAGGDLQAAIDAAQLGDTLLLDAGATFTGNFVLPVKSGSTYLTIRSAASDTALPGPTTRITPSDAAALPKIKSPNALPAMATAPGAHHYRLLALEFPATYQGFYDILTLGDGSSAQTTLAQVPHDLIVDRVYIHGDPVYGQKRGIALNSASTHILNSYIAEIRAPGQDSQAICGWNGPGPFTITNNYLEAASENLMFGGSDPAIPNLVPSDITIRGNYLTKQLAWRGQTGWDVKNLFELKNAQRVVVDGNVMEYTWVDGQVGYAVLFTPRNQDGGCPWCVVQQVTFTNNLVRHASAGITVLGSDYNYPSQQTNTIVVRNNVFEDISGVNWDGNGRWVLMERGSAAVTFDHNTVFNDGGTTLYVENGETTGFVFTNNILPDNAWAILGNGDGTGTIATYFPGSVFLDNIITGAPAWLYPAGNYYPASMADVGFVDLTGGNYRLSASSPYLTGATDGTAVGAHLDTITAAGTSATLLHAASLRLVGSFRVPTSTLGDPSGLGFSFGGAPIAFYPAHGTLFLGGRSPVVAEISIPTPVASRVLGDLPIAELRQAFADPSEGHFNPSATDGTIPSGIGGMIVDANEKLHVAGFLFYDANNTTTVSQFVRSPDLTVSSFGGWYALGPSTSQGYVGRALATVPLAWQRALGAVGIASGWGLPIISRESYGPNAVGFDATAQGFGPTTTLVNYSGDHPTLGTYTGNGTPDPVFNMTSTGDGIVMVPGYDSLLQFGRTGLGIPCYGEGTADASLDGQPTGQGDVYCYDPTSNDKGTHAYPYAYYVWAYDLHDLAAVKAGTKQPWEVVPYDSWQLSLPFAEGSCKGIAATVDPQTGRIFVSQLFADPGDGYFSGPILSVFQV